MTTDPYVWWEDYGAHALELQDLAIKIMSQAVISSCLEQLWSSFSHVASKKRNHLVTLNANDLVYVSANLHLLEHLEFPDAWKHWSEEDEEDLEQMEQHSTQPNMVSSSSTIERGDCDSNELPDHDYFDPQVSIPVYERSSHYCIQCNFIDY